ncbi:unnamed protein product [Bursaphelenchus xylophilus]|uniref:(pine wood nematode) hypothetical protein n=1 Tax=Bursaphelenchus xylophilus TaxID=6326 RepID=A0A1I7SSF9_BURXY|nr:unnamed protein product [Bursaphelenchus xylophilus]CAG9097592.1 unnamed protein product [Bursaphelenchus xylophilus]
MRCFSSMIPPLEVVKSLTPQARRNMPYVLAELEVWSELSGCEIPKMDSEEWRYFLMMENLTERDKFVSSFNKDATRDTISDTEPTGQLPYLIKGKDFRNMIDKTYGAKIWTKLKLDEEFPQIRVDCSLLYTLPPRYLSEALQGVSKIVNENWASPTPLIIHINGYSPDTRISPLAKRHWPFLYGPQKGDKHFIPHPLGPSVSSRNVTESCNVPEDQIIFVSNYGREELNETDLNKGKLFVVNAVSDDRIPKSLRETSKANSFRLPIDKYVKWKRGTKSLPSFVTVNILRDVLERKLELGDALIRNIPEKHITDAEVTREDALQIERELRVDILESASQLLKMQKNDREIMFGKELPEVQQLPPTDKRKVRFHRYSREERNHRRAREQVPNK